MAVISRLPQNKIHLSDFEANYIQTEYIQSTGTQWINSGVIPTNNTRIVLEGQTGTTGVLMGSNSCTTSNAYDIAIYYHHTDTSYKGCWKNSATTTELLSTTGEYGIQHKFEITQTSFIFDGTVVGTYTKPYTINSSYPLYLFCNNNVGTAHYVEDNNEMRIYYAKFYNGNILIRDFVPCYRKLDNVAGLYDLVEEKFYINQGTGEFITKPKNNALYLYNAGNECENAGGKWVNPSTVYTSNHNTYYKHFDGNFADYTINFTRAKNEDNLSIEASAKTKGEYTIYCGSFHKENAVDLSSYNTLCVEWTLEVYNAQTAAYAGLLGVYNTKPDNIQFDGSNMLGMKLCTPITNGSLTEVCTLDISNISKEAYVAVATNVYRILDGTKLTVHKIWLE